MSNFRLGAILVTFFFCYLIGALHLESRADAREIAKLIELGIHPAYAACAAKGCTQANWEAARRMENE